MNKYSNEFKQEVVKYCIEEKHGYQDTANHFNMNSKYSVSRWVRKYQEHGLKGLTKNSQKYDGNFKQHVIEYMHNNHLSLTETAIKFNIGNHHIVDKWACIYYEEGPYALYEERRGKNMNSIPRKKKLSNETEKNLIEEIQQLRMENEYLKKLNALVQERVKRENEKK